MFLWAQIQLLEFHILKRKQDSINNSVDLTQSKKIKQAKNEKINQKLLFFRLTIRNHSLPTRYGKSIGANKYADKIDFVNLDEENDALFVSYIDRSLNILLKYLKFVSFICLRQKIRAMKIV